MGHMFQSPLRRWDVLASVVKEMQFKTFVEVGCKEGRTTGHLLRECPDLCVTAIDPWMPIANAAEDYKDWDFAAIEAEFWKNVGEHKDRVSMLRTTSLEAAARQNRTWPTERFDMVFIDAAHDEENCLADIAAWWPKIREGGILAGHDYQHDFPGVMRAVAKSFPLMRVVLSPDSLWMVEKQEGLLKWAA